MINNADFGLKEVPLESVPYFSGVYPKEPPKDKWYKVHHDGGHYVAKPILPKLPQYRKKKKEKNELNIFFDMFYQSGLQEGYKNRELKDYIKENLLQLFSDIRNIEEYIEKQYKRCLSNTHKRFRTFRRKNNLHKWNYFITITYSDEKHTEETFRKKLRKTLSNLSTRRGWKIMGVYERGGDNNRLHFHAVAHIPDGQMVGRLFLKKDYNVIKGQMVETTQNSFFNYNYGRSDFEPMKPFFANYLLKYITKSGERIVYSRGIAQEFDIKLSSDDIAVAMTNYKTGFFVLFDDVIDYDKDVLKIKPKQINMWQFLGNTPPNYIAG